VIIRAACHPEIDWQSTANQIWDALVVLRMPPAGKARRSGTPRPNIFAAAFSWHRGHAEARPTVRPSAGPRYLLDRGLQSPVGSRGPLSGVSGHGPPVHRLSCGRPGFLFNLICCYAYYRYC